jgi:hypothetical protein
MEPLCHTTSTSSLAAHSTECQASLCGPDLIMQMDALANLKCTFPRTGTASAQSLLPVGHGETGRQNRCGILSSFLGWEQVPFRYTCHSKAQQGTHGSGVFRGHKENHTYVTTEVLSVTGGCFFYIKAHARCRLCCMRAACGSTLQIWAVQPYLSCHT